MTLHILSCLKAAITKVMLYRGSRNALTCVTLCTERYIENQAIRVNSGVNGTVSWKGWSDIGAGCPVESPSLKGLKDVDVAVEDMVYQ